MNHLPNFESGICIIPEYSELYGDTIDENKLFNIVRQYRMDGWLSFLSRIQTLLSPPYATDIERQRAAFAGVSGPLTRKLLADFEKRNDTNGRIRLFAHPQLLTLQQLAILYAPVDSGMDIAVARDNDDFLRALLATWELMMGPNEDPKDARGVTEALSRAAMQRTIDAPEIIACHAFDFYELASPNRTPAVQRLHDRFAACTGGSLEEYVLGGLTLAILEKAQEPSEIASGWTPRAPVGANSDPRVGKKIGPYCDVRCATLSQLRAEITKFEGTRPLSDWTLLALAKFPVVELPPNGKFVLSTALVGDSLFEGVRHAVITSMCEGRATRAIRQDLGKEFGDAFEAYARRNLRSVFGSAMINVPKSDSEKRADGIVLCSDWAIVFEIKSVHAPATGRLGPRSLEERTTEFAAMGLAKSADQLACTIRRLRDGTLAAQIPEVHGIDWTVTTIIPLIVTVERLPLCPGSWNCVEPHFSKLFELPLQGQICRPRMVGPTDLLRFQELASQHPLSRLLLTWARHPEAYELPFETFLNLEGIDLPSTCLKRRHARDLTHLAREVGLDVAKLRFFDEPPNGEDVEPIGS